MIKPQEMRKLGSHWAALDRADERDAWLRAAEICERLDLLLERLAAPAGAKQVRQKLRESIERERALREQLMRVCPHRNPVAPDDGPSYCTDCGKIILEFRYPAAGDN